MLAMNLYEFLRANLFKGLSLALVKHFSVQILVALNYMKDHHIVNCDLKPENIMLKKPNKSGIKLIDFGSGCFEPEQIYTYI
jgi:dual specificity tyrosine-phosphorylation-regulated kinase 2/3/4